MSGRVGDRGLLLLLLTLMLAMTVLGIERRETSSSIAVVIDPFEQIATKSFSSPSPSPIETLCPDEEEAKRRRCSSPLLEWMDGQLSRVDLVNGSLFSNESIWNITNRGCQLSNEYHQCLGAMNDEFNCPVETALNAWNAVEMYLCQLLLPSLKEHSRCFDNARHGQCVVSMNDDHRGQDEATISNMKTKRPAVCQLMHSVEADLDCVRQFAARCDESANELLGPLHTETEAIATSLLTMCPSLSSDKDNNNNNNNNNNMKDARKDEDHIDACVECGDALQMLTNLASLCNTSVTTNRPRRGVWAPVVDVLCGERESLEKHSLACLARVSAMVQCPSSASLTNNSAMSLCSAIEIFNGHMDCFISTLNDECSVEAQNAVVRAQEKLGDLAITRRCYQEATASPPPDGGFHLTPEHPRCSSEQENAALSCLVELVEVNRQLSRLQAANFLLEISNGNSSIVAGVCALYGKYEHCLDSSVFVRNHGRRCAFNSPLNTLARIGLGPICGENSRRLLIANQQCIALIGTHVEFRGCHNGLNTLGATINQMLQGINGEPLLCKSFYLIRDAFSCGERLVKKHCNDQATNDLADIYKLISALGVEEGCPSDPPADFDQYLSKTVRPPSPTTTIVQPRPTPSPSPACAPEEQRRFSQCVQPLTAFQPHPLAVIRQPKQIDAACEAYRNFSECRRSVQCRPLWALGMAAMFDFACGEAHSVYLEVRQCIRKTTAKPEIRDCVATFSKSAPQLACQSSRQLLKCSIPAIAQKCGPVASKFAKEYVDKFAMAIDRDCRLEKEERDNVEGQEDQQGETNDTSATTVTWTNCTTEQEDRLKRCARPLGRISRRLSELFQGGLQTFLANMNQLAPVFADGCQLSAEFRTCAQSLLLLSEQKNENNEEDSEQGTGKECRVSSCLIRAGDGVCDQSDSASAIDRHLTCLFGRIREPVFAKCIRTTIATLKEFSLVALRRVLPRFVDCVQEIVLRSCGAVPLNVLRAISHQDTCQLSATPMAITPSLTPAVECDGRLAATYAQCTSIINNLSFVPLALIESNVELDQVCDQVNIMDECLGKAEVCHQKDAQKEPLRRANRRMLELICRARPSFEQHRDCLHKLTESDKGKHCLTGWNSGDGVDKCTLLQETATCAAPALHDECGADAVTFSFSAMTEFAEQLNASCTVSVPSVELEKETGCSESDLLEYLQCETAIDRFQLRPISFIKNGDEWRSFCAAFQSQFRGCIERMKCRFEPASGAHLQLYGEICDDRRESIEKHAACLSNYTDSIEGRQCTDPIRTVDVLAADAPHKMCSSLEAIVNCASHDVQRQCGDEALQLVNDLHKKWARGFQKDCPFVVDDLTLTTKTKPLDEDTDETSIIDSQSSPSPPEQPHSHASDQPPKAGGDRPRRIGYMAMAMALMWIVVLALL